MRRRWEHRRKEVSDLNAEVDLLLTVVADASAVMADAERRLRSLGAENRKLRRALSFKACRDRAAHELHTVHAHIRREMSGPATSPYELEKLYAERRSLEQTIARLDARSHR